MIKKSFLEDVDSLERQGTFFCLSQGHQVEERRLKFEKGGILSDFELYEIEIYISTGCEFRMNIRNLLGISKF